MENNYIDKNSNPIPTETENYLDDNKYKTINKSIPIQNSVNSFINDTENNPLFIKKYPHAGDLTPFAFFAFGITQIIGCLQGLGAIENCPAVLSGNLFVGGLVQFLVGIYENNKGNYLTSNIFFGYGIYNFHVFGYNMMTILGFEKEIDSKGLGVFNLMWFFFALRIILEVLHYQIAFIVMNILVVLSYLLNTIAAFGNYDGLRKAACVVCIMDSIIAIYISYAIEFKNIYGKDILPLGEWYQEKKVKKKFK